LTIEIAFLSRRALFGERWPDLKTERSSVMISACPDRSPSVPPRNDAVQHPMGEAL